MMDTRANLAAGKYDNKVPHSIDKVPGNPDTMTVSQFKAHEAAEKEREREQRRLHRENEGKMTALLRADLETEHAMADHPKAGQLWMLAWAHGHSGGYSEVINYYEEFVELLK